MRQKQSESKKATRRWLFYWLNSLAVTYFRMGIHTIIGAEAFHCPVRDGKEWDHLAMAAKLDLLFCLTPHKADSNKTNLKEVVVTYRA